MALIILFKIFFGWLVIATIIMFIWSIRPKRYFEKFDWLVSSKYKQIIAALVLFSSAFGLMLVMAEGFKSLLIFIPNDLTWEGNLIRETIAIGLSLLGTGSCLATMIYNNKHRRSKYRKGDHSFVDFCERRKDCVHISKEELWDIYVDTKE